MGVFMPCECVGKDVMKACIEVAGTGSRGDKVIPHQRKFMQMNEKRVEMIIINIFIIMLIA